MTDSLRRDRTAPSTTGRGRSRAAAVLAATVLIGAPTAIAAAPAAAAPAAPGITAHQVASAPYGALFATGAQVYERVRYVREPNSKYRAMIMRRLYRPTDGQRGSARYVFLGDRLPSSFIVGERLHSNGEPGGLVIPMTRKARTAAKAPRYQSITPVAGRVGEIRAIGWSHRYLG